MTETLLLLCRSRSDYTPENPAAYIIILMRKVAGNEEKQILHITLASWQTCCVCVCVCKELNVCVSQLL